MGMGLYMVLEREVDGVDPLAADGKSVLGALGELDTAAEELGVEMLSALCALGASGLAEAAAMFAMPELTTAPPPTFRDAAIGLATVDALHTHVTAEGQWFPNAAGILADLAIYRSVLEAARDAGVGFHFTMDPP